MPQDNGLNRRKFLKGAGLTALAGATGSSSAVIADDDTGDSEPDDGGEVAEHVKHLLQNTSLH